MFETGLPIPSPQKGLKKPNSGAKTRNGQACFYSLLYHYKLRASKKGLEFLLSDETFRELTQQACFYCGSEPNQIHKKNKQTYVYSGVDRVDNLRGYVDGNVRACCGICNRAKGQLSEAEFLAWIERLTRRGKNASA